MYFHGALYACVFTVESRLEVPDTKDCEGIGGDLVLCAAASLACSRCGVVKDILGGSQCFAVAQYELIK